LSTRWSNSGGFFHFSRITIDTLAAFRPERPHFHSKVDAAALFLRQFSLYFQQQAPAGGTG
jgi:hypothetical protein